MAKLDPTQPITMADIENQKFNAQMVNEAIERMMGENMTKYLDALTEPENLDTEEQLWNS